MKLWQEGLWRGVRPVLQEARDAVPGRIKEVIPESMKEPLREVLSSLDKPPSPSDPGPED